MAASARRPRTRRAAPPVFLTVEGRKRLISRLWIGFLMSIWAVLMIYAGRDGIKPQDPATAVPAPHMIRK